MFCVTKYTYVQVKKKKKKDLRASYEQCVFDEFCASMFVREGPENESCGGGAIGRRRDRVNAEW